MLHITHKLRLKTRFVWGKNLIKKNTLKLTIWWTTFDSFSALSLLWHGSVSIPYLYQKLPSLSRFTKYMWHLTLPTERLSNLVMNSGYTIPKCYLILSRETAFSSLCSHYDALPLYGTLYVKNKIFVHFQLSFRQSKLTGI